MKRREFLMLGAGSLAAATILKGRASAAETARPAAAVSSTMKVALVQFDTVPEQIEANLQQMARLARQAAANGATWIVFHEGTVCDYTPNVDALAEPVPDGRSTRFMSGIARETGAVISFGLSERDGGRFHITQVFTGPR